MKVLYIQHASVLGGSSRSLLELIENLPSEVTPHILCPKGSYSELLEKKGIKVFTIIGIPQFDNTRFGYYRGFRWIILLREFFYLPFLFFKLIELRKEKYDLIHINDITQIFSLIIARFILSRNIVMHCRAMCSTGNTIRTKVLNWILNKFVKYLIPIDMSVSSTLPNIINKKIIHNGLSLEKINITKKETGEFTIGIVSNFQRYKGVIEFIDAANVCINEKKLDMKFVIFGASYQNTNSLKEKILHLFGFRENLNDLIKNKIINYNLDEKIILKGFIYSTNDIYNNIDLHIFPSYLNAVGRPVFEAAFYKIPSIVAINNEFDDAIINNKTGICVEEKNYSILSDAIIKLFNDRTLLKDMGEESYKLANKHYNSKINAIEIYQLYKKITKIDKKGLIKK